jgi:hypothetical protein
MLGIGGGPFIPLTGSASVTGAITSTSTFQGTKFITTGSSNLYFVLGDGTTVLTSTYATTTLLGSYLPLIGGVLTGNLKLATGTTTVAPLTFQTGISLTTAVVGAVEYDGSRVYVTSSGPTRNTLAYVSDIPATATVLPVMNGVAALGGQGKWSDGGHVHPIDTSRAPLASPVFTGTVTAPALTISLLATPGVLKNNGSGVISSTAGPSTSFVKADGSVDAGAYITGNQTITLSGSVTGSGTTAITTVYGSISANSVIANTTSIPAIPVAVSATVTGNVVSSFALRDINANLSAVNHIQGYTATAMSGSTTTLNVGSYYQQYFTGTGTTTQTVQLPVTSSLAVGQSFSITNSTTGTGTVTVQSSGSNTVVVLQPSTTATLTCILATGSTAASWYYSVCPTLGAVTVTGTGTANAIPKWVNAVGSLVNSSVVDTGSLVTITNPLTVTGTTTLATALSGTLQATSGVVSNVVNNTSSYLVLGNGTTIATSTYATAASVSIPTGDIAVGTGTGIGGTSGLTWSSSKFYANGQIQSVAGTQIGSAFATATPGVYISGGNNPAVELVNSSSTWSLNNYGGVFNITVNASLNAFGIDPVSSTTSIYTNMLNVSSVTALGNLNVTGSTTLATTLSGTLRASLGLVSTVVNNTNSYVVLGDGSTTALNQFVIGTNFYTSGLPQSVSSSTATTSLVLGITSFPVAVQAPGVKTQIRGHGTVSWASLADTITLIFSDGGTVLSTTVIAGSDLPYSAAYPTTYNWVMDLVLVSQTNASTSATVLLAGTLMLNGAYTGLLISVNDTATLNTTVANSANITAKWSAVASNDNFVVEELRVTNSSTT